MIQGEKLLRDGPLGFVGIKVTREPSSSWRAMDTLVPIPHNHSVAPKTPRRPLPSPNPLCQTLSPSLSTSSSLCSLSTRPFHAPLILVCPSQESGSSQRKWAHRAHTRRLFPLSTLALVLFPRGQEGAGGGKRYFSSWAAGGTTMVPALNMGAQA